MEKLTEKQKRFVDYYIQTGGNASESARLAGYSKSTAGRIGGENLKKLEIKNAIDARLKELESKRTANAQETLELLTSIMRGELESKEFAVVGTGDGFSKVDIFSKTPSTKERLKVAESMAKIHGLMRDKVEVGVDATQMLVDALSSAWSNSSTSSDRI